MYAALFDEDLDVEEGKRQVQDAVARYQRDHGGKPPPLVRVDARHKHGFWSTHTAITVSHAVCLTHSPNCTNLLDMYSGDDAVMPLLRFDEQRFAGVVSSPSIGGLIGALFIGGTW